MSQNGDFSISELFSQAFQPHKEDELESYWSVGAIGTIPALSEIQDDCPKPWAFLRILGIALGSYLLLLFCWSKFHNANVIPGVLITGCAIIPLSVLIFFFEMNIRRNVSMYMVSKMTILGGALSLAYALLLSLLANLCQLNLDRFGASGASFVEEIAKLLAVMLLVNRKRYPYILNGMLFGAAVGCGFAIYESAGYAFNSLLTPIIANILNTPEIITKVLQVPNIDIFSAVRMVFEQIGPKVDSLMLFNITIRGLLAPFGHVIWTALLAGALWNVKRNHEFKFSMFFDIRFIIMLLCSIGLHFAWNSTWNFRLVTAYDKYLLLGFLGWLLVLWMFRTGLRQVAEQKASASCEDGLNEILAVQHQRVTQMLANPAQTPAAYSNLNQAASVLNQTASQPAPQPLEPWENNNPLNLNDQMRQIKEQEEKRTNVDHSNKGWRKYYSK